MRWMFEYLSQEDQCSAVELASRIATGQWVLFAGSGVSIPSGLPSTECLIEILQTEVRLEQENAEFHSLKAACTAYEGLRGRAALVGLLMKHLLPEDRQPNWEHRALLRLAPPQIITTNPEDLWEKALDDANLRYSKVVLGEEYADTKPHAIILIKPHGDFEKPETLVFTVDDYASYLDEHSLISTIVRTNLIRTAVYVGYSLSDEDFIREVRWVHSQETTSIPHFIICAGVPSFRRNTLGGRGVQVIDIGTYKVLERFLSDLTAAVKKKRSGKRSDVFNDPRIAGIDGIVLDLYRARYTEIQRAISEWRLTEAMDLLLAIRKDVESVGAVEEQLPELTDFHQRVLLALANVHERRGSLDLARQCYDDALRLGELSSERLVQAAVLMANLHDVPTLRWLVDQTDKNCGGETNKLRAVLALESGDPATAVKLAGSSTDLDLVLLRTTAMLQTKAKESLGPAWEELETTWQLASIGPHMLAIAHLSERILREIVMNDWKDPKIDRHEILQKTRQRYRECVSKFETLKQHYPEGFVTACASAVEFHLYLDEDEISGEYLTLMHSAPVVTRSVVLADYMSGKRDDDLTHIEALHAQGLISGSERAIFVSRELERQGKGDVAEETLLAVLETCHDPRERQVVLEHATRLLIAHGRIDRARLLLDSEATVQQDLVRVLLALVKSEVQGPFAGIQDLEDALLVFPGSRLVAHSLCGALQAEIQKLPPKSTEACHLWQRLETAAQRAYDILPSPEYGIRLAAARRETGKTKEALHLAESIWNEGYMTSSFAFWYTQVLRLEGRYRSVAQVADAAREKYPLDYGLSLYAGTAWASCENFSAARERLEPLVSRQEAEITLFLNLGKIYLIEAATDPAVASKALDMFKRAYELDPTDPSLAPGILFAGQAGGIEREAWELLGKTGLSNNPYVWSVQPDEEIKRLAEKLEEDRERVSLLDLGMIPYATYYAKAPRPAWYLWSTRLTIAQEQWNKGLGTIQYMVQVPTGRKVASVEELGHGLVLDMTAVLTLGCHDTLDEILKSVHVAGLSIQLFPGCMDWLNSEIQALIVDQMPGYRGRFPRAKELIERTRTTFDVVSESSGNGRLSDEARRQLGILAMDVECALDKGAYYIDDYLPAATVATIPSGTLLSSRTLLDSLASRGVLSHAEVTSIISRFPRPLPSEAAPIVVNADRPVCLSDHALLDWLEAGLLDRLTQGTEGWPKPVVGPYAWQHLCEAATEARMYVAALKVARRAKEVLARGISEGLVGEIPELPGASSDSATERVWAPALDLIRYASEHELGVLTDDFFTHLLMGAGGLLATFPETRAAEERVRTAYASAPVISTLDLTRVLAGVLGKERAGHLAWALVSSGFRFPDMEFFVDTVLNEFPYAPAENSVKIAQLLRYHRNLPDALPRNAGSKRDLYASWANSQSTLDAIDATWRNLGCTSDPARCELADKFLASFEENIGSPWSQEHENLWTLLGGLLIAGGSSRVGEALNWLGEAASSSERKDNRSHIVRCLEKGLMSSLEIGLDAGCPPEEFAAYVLLSMAPMINHGDLALEMNPTLRQLIGYVCDLPDEGRYAVAYSQGGSTPVEITVHENEVEEAALAAISQLMKSLKTPGVRLRATRIQCEFRRTLSDQMMFVLPAAVPLIHLLPHAPRDEAVFIIDVLSESLGDIEPGIVDGLSRLRDVIVAVTPREEERERRRLLNEVLLSYLRSAYFNMARDLPGTLRQLSKMDLNTFDDYCGWAGLLRLSGQNDGRTEGSSGLSKATRLTLGLLRGDFSADHLAQYRERLEAEYLVLDVDGRVAWMQRLVASALGPNPFVGLAAFMVLVVLGQVEPDADFKFRGKDCLVRKCVTDYIQGMLMVGAKSGSVKSEVLDPSREASRRSIHAKCLQMAVSVCGSNRHLEALAKTADADLDGVIVGWLVRSLAFVDRLLAVIFNEYEVSTDDAMSAIDEAAASVPMTLSPDVYPDLLNPFVYGPEEYDHVLVGLLEIMRGTWNLLSCQGKNRPYWFDTATQDLLKEVASRQEVSGEAWIRSATGKGIKGRFGNLLCRCPSDIAAEILSLGEKVDPGESST